MDAPKGRYKVVEKDGRLIVIDNATGRPASGTIVPPRPGSSPVSGPARSPGPGSAGSPISTASGTLKTWLDGFSTFLLHFAVSEWDDQGNAIIHWSWKHNNEERRWDAGLDADEQRRLGRGLAAIAVFPLFILLFLFGSGIWMLAGMALIAAPVVWGAISIAKLRDETNLWRLPRE